MDAQDTARLVGDARAGSAHAVDELYRRSAAKLLPLIRARMGPALRSEAESRDILQAVLLKAHQRFDQLDDPAALMAWLARIAEHEMRDRADYRRRQRRDADRNVPLDAAADVPSPIRQALSLAIASEQRARFERALDALSAPQREIIVLRTLEELTFPDIAARLGKREDACRMAFARAMSALTLVLAGDRS